jgi:tetratricopeptide (TPR) repeat protein
MKRFACTLALALSWSSVAFADGVEEAKPHFQHAKELYEQGNYKDAFTELQTARHLDPNAKDLVINLGIVSEKLGRIDDALKYYNTYLEMDLTEQERTRAELTIKRLRGVKRTAPPPDDGNQTPPPNSGVAPPPDKPSRGKMDALTVSTGVLGIGGLTLGVIFGAAALASRPPANFVTGRDGTFQELNDKAQNAHTLAIVSDVSLIAGGTFLILATTLFFARTNDVQQRGANKPNVTVTILPAGIGGTF